jgi:hypothetical protein
MRQPQLSEAQAFAKVYESSENREIVKRERSERAAAARTSGRRFLLTLGSTEIATLLWVLSELAKEAADRLQSPKPPRAHREPEKDVAAFFAYILMLEFPPRRVKQSRVSARNTSDDVWHEKWKLRAKPQRTIISENRNYIEENRAKHHSYIAEHWPRLSPKFRATYNAWLVEQDRWRRRRGQPPGPAPLPPPAVDEYVPPRHGPSQFQEPSSSPRGPYLSIAPLLFEYFTRRKPDKGLEAACRKVLKQFPRRRREAIG